MKQTITIILLLSLAITIILGKVVLGQDQEPEGQEVEKPLLIENKLSSNYYLLADSRTPYIKKEVLAAKAEKAPEKSNFSEKEGKEYYRTLIEQYDWHQGVAMAVMREESGYDPEAYNPEWHEDCNCRGSYGLMQIACCHFGKHGIDWDNWKDPETNINAAHEIWKREGWRPWGVCHKQNGVRKVRCWL